MAFINSDVKVLIQSQPPRRRGRILFAAKHFITTFSLKYGLTDRENYCKFHYYTHSQYNHHRKTPKNQYKIGPGSIKWFKNNKLYKFWLVNKISFERTLFKRKHTLCTCVCFRKGLCGYKKLKFRNLVNWITLCKISEKRGNLIDHQISRKQKTKSHG